MKHYYLAHQLKHRFLVREIELQLEKKFNIELVNPFYDGKRRDIQKLDKGNFKRTDFSLKDAKKIVENDLKAIDRSDGIVSIIIDIESIGSYMEIFYGYHVLHKPVYVISPDVKIRKHIWIKSNSTKQFSSITNFEKWLKRNVNKL